MDSKESYKQFMKSFNTNLRKQLPKYVSKIVNDDEFSRDILFKCYDQFNNGLSEIEIKLNNDEEDVFKIKKSELEEISENYINDICQLIADIIELNKNLESQIIAVYYIFANFMTIPITKLVKNCPVLRYVEGVSSLLNIAIMVGLD